MKHLIRYTESLQSKEPIDPTLDVEEFKDKFSKKKSWSKVGALAIDEPNIKRILDNIVSSNPTMTDDWKIYGVFNTDDNGRRRGDYMFYVKAVSENHARIKAATFRNNIEIISTGYYRADVLSNDDIDGMIDALEHEINLLKN